MIDLWLLRSMSLLEIKEDTEEKIKKLEGEISRLKDFEIELRKRNVQCHIMGMSDGTGTIFFPKADYDKAVEALDVVEGNANPTVAPPEQKQDKPLKKHRSL